MKFGYSKNDNKSSLNIYKTFGSVHYKSRRGEQKSVSSKI